VDGTGELTTHPILFDEQDLVINAQVEQTGSLRVEVLDQDGHTVDGYGLSDSDAFAGDEVEHRPSWNGRRLSELSGRSLKFRIVLEKTRLFTLHVE
jgi:glyoxylase-like metal-dependent hydrolase (beta-lactamase superfamily II)